MSNICPKSCAGLATAAIFIAAGTVQLVAGLILLRSDYVYMLSGPDFWTATANISVGCLLGIAASIWKLPHRKKTTVVIARYNLIAALLVSSITVNATTCTILILSKESMRHSILLEQDGENRNATLSEMLGYAYAASVISPAICIIMAAAALTAKCCPTKAIKSKKRKLRKKKTHKKVLCRHNPDRFHWVYTTPEADVQGDKSLEPETKSFSSSDSEFDSNSTGVSLTFSSPTPNRGRSAGIKKPRVSFDAKDPEISRPDFNDSELSVQSSFDLNTSVTSMAGKVVPVQLGRTMSRETYRIGLPFPSPVLPDHWRSETLVKTPANSTSSLNSPSECPRSPFEGNFNFGKKRSSFTSFHDDKFRTDFLKHCPKIDPIRALHLREGRFPKLFPMDSITEDIVEELKQKRGFQTTISPSQTSGYVSSPDVTISSCLNTPPADYPIAKSVHEEGPISKRSLFHSTSTCANGEDPQELKL